MNFDLTDEQKLLKDQARRMLSERASYARLRSMLDAGAAWDPELWQEMAGLGWLGAAIPEEYGGLGLTDIELCVLSEELGRQVAPVPFSSSIGLAAGAIAVAGSEEQKRRLLPKLATGELIGTFAYAEGAGYLPDQTCATRHSAAGITGRKWPVPDGQLAHFAVVTACDADGETALTLVELDQAGVTRATLAGFDPSRQSAVLEFRNAKAELLRATHPAMALRNLFDRNATLTAFEQLGGAEAALQMARDYVVMRQTFGRAVGSYQAVKHRLADMLVAVELARSNAYFAAWALSNDASETPLAAASARLSATEAYNLAAEECLHLHGGIGYTWEADCHFHYRRARVLALTLGSSAYWSNRLINRLTQDTEAVVERARVGV